MSRGRQALAMLLLAGFGMALSLLVLEVGVRALHLVPTRFWEEDGLLGTRLVADREGWWTQEDHEFIVPIKINSQGRRDLERSVEKPPDAFRVLVLGDSFIEAMQVPLEQSFSRRLESELGATLGADAVQVMSMGVSGYGTASQTLYYEEFGRRLDPDLVLLAFYPANDVRNNSPTLEPLLRPIYDDEGNLRRVVTVGNDGTTAPRNRGVLWNLQSYQYARKLVLTKQPALAGLLADVGLLKRTAIREGEATGGVPIDYGMYSPQLSAEWEDAWQRTTSLLTRLKKAVEKDGAQLVVMIVTARDHIYPEAWSRILEANPAMREREWDLDAPERRVLEWCQRSEASCIRLSPVFGRHAERGESLHYMYDGHWNAAGHALAARTVAENLGETGLLNTGRGNR